MGFFRDAIRAGRESAQAPLRARAEELTARLAELDPAEAHTVALGAGYRNVFLSELGVAKIELRPPAYLFLAELPANEVDNVRGFLARDFEVVDAQTAEDAIDELDVRLEGSGHPAEVALWVTRACWVAGAAEGLELVSSAQARAWQIPFVHAARTTFGGWREFGEHFLAGEAASPASNVFGRRSLRKSVEALLDTPGSPWRELPWPTAPTASADAPG